jgi:uncharacterized protein YbjT (DUF2867 family)
MSTETSVFITGGTGFMGQRLIPELLTRGWDVRALVRPGSEPKLPSGAQAVAGDATKPETFADQVKGCSTFVHLLGARHPGPHKGAQFESLDFASVAAAVAAAQFAGVQNFIYMSVAMPLPIMQSYVAARRKGEALLRESGLNATFLRPFYVIGPGRMWPLFLLPVYAVFNAIPRFQQEVKRLEFINHKNMTRALLYAVEHPAAGVRIWEAPEIRKF